jgi:hypothetical protein
VRFSERISPRWRRCFSLRPFVLRGESLVCSFVGRQMMAALASFLFGGIIFHVLLASISLAPSCESVGDVLAFLLFSFVQA